MPPAFRISFRNADGIFIWYWCGYTVGAAQATSYSLHWMRMEQRAPPAERNELISHIGQSFVTGSCWRMRILCVSCEFVYTVPSIAMLAEMLLPLSVCVSIVLPS